MRAITAGLNIKYPTVAYEMRNYRLRLHARYHCLRTRLAAARPRSCDVTNAQWPWDFDFFCKNLNLFAFNNKQTLPVAEKSTGFIYINIRISSVREYFYFGIIFTLNGSLKNAQQKLKEKYLRSYFSLKSLIDKIPLKHSVVFKLFDSSRYLLVIKISKQVLRYFNLVSKT